MPSEFVVDAGDGNTPTHHALEIYRDSLKITMFAKMGLMGRRGSGKVITVDTRLQQQPGETVNVHFVPFENIPPILGQDASVQGNESKFNEFTTSVTVDEVNFPFLSRGRMTAQRTILDVRKEMRMQIANHFAQYNETEMFKRLSGVAQTEVRATWESSTNSTNRVNAGPTTGTGRALRASGSNSTATVTEEQSDNDQLAGDITSADKISPNAIMKASVTARRSASGTNATYKMQPIRVSNGKEMFLCFLSPNAVFDLMTHPEWITRAIAVGETGLDKDPIAMSALGTIKNVIVHESEHVIEFDTDASGRAARNLLVGQDAGFMAWSQTLEYVEQFQDYKRKLGVNGSEIRGEIKVAFEDKDNAGVDVDYGVFQIVTASDD